MVGLLVTKVDSHDILSNIVDDGVGKEGFMKRKALQGCFLSAGVTFSKKFENEDINVFISSSIDMNRLVPLNIVTDMKFSPFRSSFLNKSEDGYCFMLLSSDVTPMDVSTHLMTALSCMSTKDVSNVVNEVSMIINDLVKS